MILSKLQHRLQNQQQTKRLERCGLYEKYKKLADKEEKTIFGGRLGEYKYYDMDATIDSVLNLCEKEFGDR